MATRENPIRVLIADDMADTRDSLDMLLSFETDIEVVGTAADGAEAVEKAQQLLPDVVLMDINMPVMDGIQAAEIISSELLTCQVIMMSVQGDAEYLRRSMLAGAREFLVKPFTGDEMAGTIRHVFELQSALRIQEPEPEPTPLEIEPIQLLHEGELIMVYSPRGGTGVTTLACNLAVALAHDLPGRVVLVDNDPNFGDIALAMDIESHTSINDIAGYGARFDTDVLNGLLIDHVSGAQVLLGPPRPGHPQLPIEMLATIFDKLRATRPFTIVDNPSGFSETTYALMERASKILLVVTLDMPSIKDAKLFLQIARGAQLHNRVTTVVNRADDSTEISLVEVESILGRKIDHTLTAHPRLATFALNRGVPFVMSNREAPLSKEIIKLAQTLQGKQAAAAAAAAQLDEPELVGIGAEPRKKGGFFKFPKLQLGKG